MSHKVFVYGTLKQNEPNHHWLTNVENGQAIYQGQAITKKKFPLIIATKYNIPFLLYQPGEGLNILGELYEVDEKMLLRLDVLEEHPKYYERQIEDILLEKGTEKVPTEAWVYFLKNFKKELLKRPRLGNYSSRGSHGLVYMDRSKRDPKYDYKVEVRNNESTIEDIQDLLIKK